MTARRSTHENRQQKKFCRCSCLEVHRDVIISFMAVEQLIVHCFLPAWCFQFFRPHRSAPHEMWPVVTRVAWSVCLFVGHKHTSPAKTDEPIEMRFGVWTHAGSRNHVFWTGPRISPAGRGSLCVGCIWACPDLPAVDVLNTGHRCCRQAASQISHTAIGVNAAWVAGVATPQYLTCMGRPVLTSPHPRRLYTAPRFSSLRRSTCDTPPRCSSGVDDHAHNN